MGDPAFGTQLHEKPPEDQLDSWKEIAAYLGRDVTTVQRWEKLKGCPCIATCTTSAAPCTR